MKYHDAILQLPFHLSAHVMEGKLKIILGSNPESEEIISFYSICSCMLQTIIAITLSRLPCFGYDTLQP